MHIIITLSNNYKYLYKSTGVLRGCRGFIAYCITPRLDNFRYTSPEVTKEEENALNKSN